MSTPSETSPSRELRYELELFRKLRPYISHCLRLNHDINNPLAGIIGYCEFLLENEDSFTAEQQNYLQQILACAERIRKVVDNLCEEKILLSEDIDTVAVTEHFGKDSHTLE